MPQEVVTVEEMQATVLRYLNSAVAADPAAIHSLIMCRVPCNQQLVDHDHAIVDGADGGLYYVGLLGVINGLLTSLGMSPVAMRARPSTEQGHGIGVLEGFVPYVPPKSV